MAVSLVRASLYTAECAAPLTLGLVEKERVVGGTMETSLECQLAARARLAVQDHVIGRSVVFPGVGYVELAVAQLETGISTSREDTVARNVAFVRIWSWPRPQSHMVRLDFAMSDTHKPRTAPSRSLAVRLG